MLDVRAFFGFLRRRARLILATMAAVIVCAFGALALIAPRYTATAVVLVDPRQQRIVQSEAVLSGIGSDAAAVESQVEIIESRTIAERVIRELNLEHDPEFAKESSLGLAIAWLRDLIGRPAALDDTKRFEKIAARFQENLKVRRRGLTYVLEVGFMSEEAGKAARIANAVAEAYLNDQIAAKLEATLRASGWLNDRIEELRAKVRDSERAVEAYKAENNIVGVGLGQTLDERQIAELNQQLILARARTAEAHARLEQVKQAAARTAPSGSLPEALQSQVIASLRAQYAQLASSEADLRSTYGERHPALGTIRAQLEKVNGQIDREVARIASGLRNEYEAAQSREHSLEASLAALKQQYAGGNQATVRLRELEREAQANRALFEQFLLRFKETTEQQSLAKADARVVSVATPPVKPSHPKTTLILLIAAAGSMFIGVGIAALADNIAQGFRSGQDLEERLGLPNLGSLPRIDATALGARLRRRRAWLRFGRAKRDDARRGIERALMRFGVDQPLSPFAEALRAIRLRLRGGDTAAAHVVLVTSALPGEGKSTVAMNLAHALAKNGTSTLLIDMDLRNAYLTRVQAPRAAGLFEVLNADIDLRSAIRKDSVSGAHFLPAGRVADPGAAPELLMAQTVARLIQACREKFDMVILDAPPLLPVVDSRHLIEHADAGLLVVEWSQTASDAVFAALKSLDGSSDKVLGAVLNKVDPRAEREYDYGYGGYGDLRQAA